MVNHPFIMWASQRPAEAAAAATSSPRRLASRRAPFVARHYRVLRLFLWWLG